jgi:hypothetical protein
MQLGILKISFNSSAIRSHSSEVGAVTYIDCTTFQMAFPDSRTMPCTIFFPTRKSIPKTQMIPIGKITETDFLSQTPRNVRTGDTINNYMRERRKYKEKLSGNGTTLKAKWQFYKVVNFFWSTTSV